MILKPKDLTLLIANPWADVYKNLISKRFPELKIIEVNLMNEQRKMIKKDVSEVNIILSFAPLIRSQPKMNKLRWFQSLSAGVDHIISSGVLKRDVILTNAAGVASIGIAEFTITLMLAFSKKFPRLFQNQSKKKWDLWCSNELHGKILGILGLGHLGKHLAKMAKLGFNMFVIGYDKFVNKFEYADVITLDLEEVLKMSDFLVVMLPLNEETKCLLGEDQFKIMKPNAFFINIARGEIVVKEALVKALKENWIAGAGLDVFWGADPSEMILSPDDELWKFKNVIISPHTAWLSENYAARATDLFCQNFDRFLNGIPLINEVKW